jgi:L-erythro-3,5-diaminohexanoate dehydrogenase
MIEALDIASANGVAASACAYGSHRVLEPTGALPQAAHRLDATPVPRENELLVHVDALNIDSASFRQIATACDGDRTRIAAHIAALVAERGKLHNPVTGSGGMFVGRVAAFGSHFPVRDLNVGDRIASLVSLTLTPLHLEEIVDVDLATTRVRVRGSAILFASGIYARLPGDIDEGVALAALDVAGAPAQVLRLAQPGATVVVIGADGKSGLFASICARERVGPHGLVFGVGPERTTPGARLLVEGGYVDAFIEADARDALGLSRAVAEFAPNLADLTVNCVNVPGTELGSILSTREGGSVYFFSMSTSFTAAALGAEGVGQDVTMIVGNGYARGHAEVTFRTLRTHPDLHAHFIARFATGVPQAQPVPGISG